MSEKKSFIMYMDQRRLINKLSDEEAGKLLKAVYEYQATGQIAELPPAADMLFGVICNQLDRDNAKWARTVERRAEAGRAGGRAKAEGSKQMLANASKSKQMLANVADNDNDTDNVNVSVNESENDNDNESAGEPRADGPPSASSPTPTPDNTKPIPRGTFGNVLLTDAEMQRLKEFRPNDWEQKLAYLDGYIARTGKTYDNHLLTIITWAEDDDKKAPPAPKADTSVHFENEQKNKGKNYDGIFLRLFSPEADEYIRNGTWPYRKQSEQ